MTCCKSNQQNVESNERVIRMQDLIHIEPRDKEATPVRPNIEQPEEVARPVRPVRPRPVMQDIPTPSNIESPAEAARLIRPSISQPVV